MASKLRPTRILWLANRTRQHALLPPGLDDGRPPPTGAIGHLHRLTAHWTEVLGCAWRQRPRAPEQRALAWRLPLDALDGLGRLLRSGGSSGAGLGLATA